jgi:hypothetical protein
MSGKKSSTKQQLRDKRKAELNRLLESPGLPGNVESQLASIRARLEAFRNGDEPELVEITTRKSATQIPFFGMLRLAPPIPTRKTKTSTSSVIAGSSSCQWPDCWCVKSAPWRQRYWCKTVEATKELNSGRTTDPSIL